MMEVSNGRGAFIVFEGLDRCGKTTQVRLLCEYLQQNHIPFQQMRFPDRTKVTGIMCDRYLRKAIDLADFDVHELFSANRWECKAQIEALLHQGVTLVVDRYAFSGVAYTAAKGYDLELCKRPDRGLPAPDRVIYLNVPIEETQKRGNFGEEAGARYEKAAFQLKVGERYQQLADSSFFVVDGTQPIQAVHKTIALEVLGTIQRVRQQKLGKLWVGPEPVQPAFPSRPLP